MAQYVQKVGGQAVDLTTTGFKTLQDAANAGYNPVSAPTTTPVAPTPVAPTSPISPSKPVSPVAPIAPTSAQTYIVQPGDTLSAIASKLGVKPTDLSGYKSGNPNLIYPKEVLQVGQSAPVAPVTQTTQTTSQPKPSPEQAQQQFQQQAEEQAQEKAVQLSDEEQALNYLKEQYGFTGDTFATQPQKSLQDLITEVMTATGLPEAKTQITEITKQIEDLNNERDAKIAEVNDNPWLSESMRVTKVNKIATEYENKTANRVNQLTLLQGAYDDARQQAQWAATTAISMFDRQQTFDQEKLEFMIEKTEKALEAKQKLGQDTADKKVDQDQDMIAKGFFYVKTPAERDRLKNEGYQIVELGGRTYAKPQKLTKVTYKGTTTWYNEQGEKVNPSSSQVASQGGGSMTVASKTTSTNNEKSAIVEMTTAISQNVGADGFLSPQDHQELRNQWIQAGLSATSFDTKFKGYLNPNNPNYITKKQ
ncbi:MAG: LysM domain-containing protein [Bacilli bacterium]|nr:LysM domain-containing protein [Bacilli bacterium]